MYSVRLICADSYQAAPIPDIDPTFSQFRGSHIKQVPIIRIFGTTLTGDKVCLHIHGVFPYMYVPYSGQINADVLSYRLAASLDTTINRSLGSANSNIQHIYKIQQVSGMPFYGYHKKQHHFFKIYFYNPAIVNQATNLLQNGCILGEIFQPYEAHISFILQFMIDYNIYGMSLINLKNVKHRHSYTTDQSIGDLSHNLDEMLDPVLKRKEYLPFSVIKQSVCELEIDAWASDILNREIIDKGIDMNPGIAAIWEEEKARRVQVGLGGNSQLMYPKSPKRSQVASILKNNEIYYKTQLDQRLSTIDSQNESSLSPSLENLSYPSPVSNDSNLLNASQLEVHTGPIQSTTLQECQNELVHNIINESMILSLQSSSLFSDLSLNSNDMNIVDMLVNLAEEQQNISSSIDSNSILGSQKSVQAYQELFLINDKVEDIVEEEEVEDLNITSGDLSSLNLSLWETNKRKSQPQPTKSNDSQIELVLKYSKDPVALNSSNNVPQFDGPINEEEIRTSNSNKSINLTLESEEFLICEYKSEKRFKSKTTITPCKRKHNLNSNEEDTYKDIEKNKSENYLPKTPHKSPSTRLKKLTSPSCPSRNYSPLTVEITTAQKTKRNLPCTSPSTSWVRKKFKKNLEPKRLLATVKESNLEKKDVPSIDSELIKQSTKISEKLFPHDSDSSDSSDKTLVGDSDDSLKTIVSSPKNVIINESDSNDTQKQSNLTNCNYSNDSLLFESEIIDKKKCFSQLIETKQKTSNNQINSSATIKDSDTIVTIIPKFKPPNRDKIEASLESYGFAKYDNVQPFFSEQSDIDALLQNNIGIPIPRVKGRGLSSLTPFRSSLENVMGLDHWRKMKVQEFHLSSDKLNSLNLRRELAGREIVTIRPLKPPPNKKSVLAWLKARENEQKKTNNEVNKKSNTQSSNSENSDNSIFLNPSFDSSKMYKGNEGESNASKHLGISCGQIEFNTRSSIVDVEHGNLGKTKALTTYQFLTIFCLEVHVITRSNFLPDPQYDAIEAIFYAIYNDVPPNWSKTKPLECGVIIADRNKNNSELKSLNDTIIQETSVIYVENEDAMFNSVLSIIERCNPEILIGWDLELFSWGYMFQRATILGKNLSEKISRIPNTYCNWETEHNQSSRELHFQTLSEIKLRGRIVLEIWRIMKHEIALTNYTYENVMFHVLNERIPHPSFEILTKWWKTLNCRWRVIDHYINKVVGIHRLLHHLDIINRTSEHARLYGIQFYEVFSRGSQFRVESMMLRLAKPLNYIPISPSAQQRGGMRAPESLPLILEPESTMYIDPVVVLDFQSLYPSIIIAYNYCFSTCLGRIEHIGSSHPFEFGAVTLKVDKNLAMKLRNKIHFAPCGVAFVKKEVRQGILPRMLTEILETRLMVKKAIKDHSKEDRALQRVLDSRQLGLKLIANVTYGYTAANFSGRMPCIEVGDSIVSKGKETLERAIQIVESTSKWRARVIYGDTDSLFVLLKGKSREEAFKIGAEIAEAITAANPKPVKLKFEKIMQPCILQTKKRYCGYKYENLNDKPVFLAKGIETVRRDGCPAVVKILEKTLRILFDTKDLSLVKQYVMRQLDKILTGRVSIQDLTFAKEFRGMKGYKATACVPALELTRRLIQKDPRAVPRTGARVPYIIIAGGPNELLIRCVRSPMELILDPSLRPNAIYYITKVIIPPINRCLNLIGIDANTWFMEMPHRKSSNKIQRYLINTNRKQKTTISQYLCNTTCPSCGESCDKGICTDCINNQSQTLVILYEKCRQYERIYSNIKMMCESCIGIMDANSCTSLDCPIFYRRIQAQIDNTQVSYLYNLIQCMEYLS